MATSRDEVAEVARWAEGLEWVHECIAGRFRRPEPRRRALDYLRGLLGPGGAQEWLATGGAGGRRHPGRRAAPAVRLPLGRWSGSGPLRDYVVEYLGGADGVLVVDETGFLKKGNKPVGVQRQYSGTAGRTENCQIGVFLAYACARGRTLLDRELHLLQVWAGTGERRREAGVPEGMVFRTKPQWPRVCWSGQWNRESPSAGLRGMRSTATAAT